MYKNIFKNSTTKWLFFKLSTFLSAVKYAKECMPIKIDLIFLLDGSGSLGSDDFQKILKWVRKLVEKILENKKVSLYVGVIVFRYTFFFVFFLI